ncbi:MAG: V-type ATP synthase subunit I [Ruminococcaceae bacterium]|nr:V-type ATP synthase subunit I [Oscillospiraceae bacterium]
MAILKMKRIEILAMLSDSKSIVDLVQQSQAVHVIDYTEESNNFYKFSTGAAVGQFDKFYNVTVSAREILNRYVPVKGGLIASFAPRPDLSVSDFHKKAQAADEILSKCYGINALYKEIQDCRVEIVRVETALEQMRPWENLDIPSSFKETASTAVFVGSMEGTLDREAILSKIAELGGDFDLDVKVTYSDKNLTCLVAICHKDDAKDVEQALRTIGYVAPSDPTKHEPKVRIARLEKEIEKCNEKIAENEEKIKTYAEFRDDIAFLEDYFVLRMDKYKALDKISMSNNIFVLRGYIPEPEVEPLQTKLEKLFDVAISVSDPDFENEDVPVALENGTIGRTMEPITEMYGTPTHDDVDPNTVMTWFYYLLFGFMLGDAGYGVIMLIVCLIVMFKYRLEPHKAKTVHYALLCSIGTIVWGALFNGWFGDLPMYIANGFNLEGVMNRTNLDFISANHLYWFLPLEHTTRFLLFAFFIGILHLGLGVAVSLYNKLRHKQILEALVQDFPNLLILAGVIPLINSQLGAGAFSENPPTKFIDDIITVASKPLYICLIAGFALVFVGPVILAIKDKKPFLKILGGFASGANDFYGAASGYIGDILSYARLLALGLCTGVIASVINQLAAMPGNPILFVIFAIFGHTINLGINLIGTYVHTNRLQYVEFFSKFYESGGLPFKPLNVKTKSFKFKEEI